MGDQSIDYLKRMDEVGLDLKVAIILCTHRTESLAKEVFLQKGVKSKLISFD